MGRRQPAQARCHQWQRLPCPDGDRVRAWPRGRAKLTTAKDRCGNFVRGAKAAEFVLDATTTPYQASLVPPEPSTAGGGNFRPTYLMERVSRWLELNPGASRRSIDQAKLGKAEYIRRATDTLVTESYVRTEQSGQAVRHYTTRAYREGAEAEPEPEEEPF